MDEVRHGSGEADGGKGQNREGEDCIEAVEQGMHIPVVSALPPAPDRLARCSLFRLASWVPFGVPERERERVFSNFRSIISMLFHCAFPQFTQNLSEIRNGNCFNLLEILGITS